MKGMMLIENKKTRTRSEVRLTEKQKEQIDRAAKRCGITASEYLRQRALDSEPKAVLPDTFFVCCEKLDRLTRVPYAKDVNEAALAVLTDIRITTCRRKSTESFTTVSKAGSRNMLQHGFSTLCIKS